MKLRFFLLIVGFFAMVFLCSGSAKANQASAHPSADTWLDTANPNTTHPTGDLRLYYNNGAWQWSTLLLKFDLTLIPVNSTVISASLNIVAKSCSGYSSPNMIAKRVTANWTQDTATWQVMQNRVTTADQATNAVFPCVIGSNVPFNVTNIVQSWVNGNTNNGFRVDPDTDIHAASFDYSFYDSSGSLPPYLQIMYTPPSGGSSNGNSNTPASGTSANNFGTTGSSSTSNNTSTGAANTNATGTTSATNDGTTAVAPDTNSTSQPASVIDAIKHPSKIFTTGWPWWKKAIAIWIALVIIIALVGVAILVVKKTRRKI